MTEQHYHDGRSASILGMAAQELFTLARLEFDFDHNSRDGLAFSQLALLTLRVAAGVPLPHASENFRFFVDLENSTGGHHGNFR